MDQMISYCGLSCAECPAYVATQENNDEKRLKVAKMWGKMFNTEFKVEDINCDGCQTENGKLFGHCTSCVVRLCGINKKVENCAHCNEYSCEKLNGLLQILSVTSARDNLEKIKKSL